MADNIVSRYEKVFEQHSKFMLEMNILNLSIGYIECSKIIEKINKSFIDERVRKKILMIEDYFKGINIPVYVFEINGVSYCFKLKVIKEGYIMEDCESIPRFLVSIDHSHQIEIRKKLLELESWLINNSKILYDDIIRPAKLVEKGISSVKANRKTEYAYYYPCYKKYQIIFIIEKNNS